MSLTIEQKEANKLARKQAKEESKKLAMFDNAKNQKHVERIKINIEWKKSRMWGANPHLEAKIWFKDGSFTTYNATAGGCGYDKESTVIAEVFREFLRYKLFEPRIAEALELPYGMRKNTVDYLGSFDGGVGTGCYYKIAETIGGKFIHLAGGNTFDAYEYIDNETV